MSYSEKEVINFIEHALELREIGPLFNVGIRNGQLVYTSCIPGRHQIRDHHDALYDVTATNELVIVGVNVENKNTRIFYPHELSSCSILEKKAETRKDCGDCSGLTHEVLVGADHLPVGIVPKETDAVLEFTDELPGIGSLWTHSSGRPYMAFGYANLDAKPEKQTQYPPLVLYIGQNGKVWAKTVERFHETMVRGARFAFQKNAGLEFMGILENDELVNGYITREVREMIELAQGERHE